MDALIADIRYGLKVLTKSRAFALASLLTLVLCIAANSAIFSVINSVLLQPLPFPGSDRVVLLHNSYPGAGAPRSSNGVPDYFDRLNGTTAFSELALIRGQGYTVGESGNPERITGMAVTPSFFRLVQVPALRGRWFTPEEGEYGAHRKVILSYALWQERYGGRNDALGGTLRISGIPYEIVGVMPRNFRVANDEARLWTALAFTPEEKSDDRRHSNSFQMLGRLKDGVSLAQAQAQIDAVNRRNDERFPQFKEILQSAGFRTFVVDFRSDLVRDVRSTLVLLQAGCLLVLLIGCVNIANLLLVRSTGRTRELATRAALGAGRLRLVRQLLTESVVLAAVGGLLGLGLGWAAVRAFSGLAAELIPRGGEVTMDWRVTLLTLALTAVAGLLFGTIPVVRVWRANLSAVFREEGRTGTAGRGAVALRGGLVVAQVSLAFALMIGAGLLLASFRNVLHADPGFRPDNVLTAAIALNPTRYSNAEQRAVAWEQLQERVRALPGVASVGIASVLPFSGDYNSSVFTADDYQPRPGESPISPPNTEVSAGYFEAMGIELVKGRLINENDRNGTQRVYVIDEWLAQRFWPGQDPIGKQAFQGVRGFTENIAMHTVVGVVRNVQLTSFGDDPMNGHYYAPSTQQPPGRAWLIVRSRGDATALTASLRTAVLSIDPDMPLYDVRTMHERMAESRATDRVRMILLLVFSGIALFLSGVGLYGVLAYTVAQRTSELGIRLALGSSTREVFGLVLKQGLRLTTIGLFIGLAASLGLSRLLRTMLFNVQPNDPMVFAAVFVVLAGAAVLACLTPARRATRIDPILALKDASV